MRKMKTIWKEKPWCMINKTDGTRKRCKQGKGRLLFVVLFMIEDMKSRSWFAACKLQEEKQKQRWETIHPQLLWLLYFQLWSFYFIFYFLRISPSFDSMLNFTFPCMSPSVNPSLWELAEGRKVERKVTDRRVEEKQTRALEITSAVTITLWVMAGIISPSLKTKMIRCTQLCRAHGGEGPDGRAAEQKITDDG